MKSRAHRARTRRRVKYAIYITAVITTIILVFYLNFRRERNLLRVQVRRALIQEILDADTRFKNIKIGIDRARQVSMVTGSVASDEDFKELNRKFSKTPPFPGTYNWQIEVEVGEFRNH